METNELEEFINQVNSKPVYSDNQYTAILDKIETLMIDLILKDRIERQELNDQAPFDLSLELEAPSTNSMANLNQLIDLVIDKGYLKNLNINRIVDEAKIDSYLSKDIKDRVKIYTN